MPLRPQQTQIARLLYQLGIQHGLNPKRAREFVAAAYEESGLQPGINNRAGSGAAGLFQLLSKGYVNRANQLGGVHNPRANALVILPDYQRYWASHPGAAPGQAARDVERSGQGSGFYSRHLGMFGTLGGGAATAALSPAVRPPTRLAATPESSTPDNPQQTGLALLQAIRPGPQHGDFSQVFELVRQRVAERARAEAEHHVGTAHAALTQAGLPVNPRTLHTLLGKLGLLSAVTSGYRPGARTAHGTTSFHSLKDAGGFSRGDDINPHAPHAQQLIDYAKQHPEYFKEFIYSRLPWFIKDGRMIPISQLNRVDYKNHLGHIHVAR